MIMARKKLSDSTVWWKNLRDGTEFMARVIFGTAMYEPDEHYFKDEAEFWQAVEFWKVPEHRHRDYRRHAFFRKISAEQALKFELEDQKLRDSAHKETMRQLKQSSDFQNNPHQRVCRTCFKEMAVKSWSDNPCCGPMMAINPSDPEVCTYDKAVAFIKKQKEAKQ